VFVSITSAIKHLLGRPVWTEESLVREFANRGNGDVNFTSVMKVAEELVVGAIEWEYYWDSPRKESPSEERLSSWLDRQGIVIVSLELVAPDSGTLKRKSRWHMLTLIARDGDYFQVWDRNGLGGFIKHAELESGIVYPDGTLFVVHDNHNMVFLRRI